MTDTVATAAEASTEAKRAIRIGLGQLQSLSPEDAAFARQHGLTTIQLNTPTIPGDDGFWQEADLRRLRDDIAAEGLTLEALENVPIGFYDKVMLGKPGWEDQLERYCITIRNVGAAGIGFLGHHLATWRYCLEHGVAPEGRRV